MLKALYDYAARNHLVLPAGYVYKTVKAFLSLSSVNPTNIGIVIDNEEAYLCPDVANNVPNRSGVLIEKRSVVIPEEETAKSRYFLEALRSASQYIRDLSVCVAALETPEIAALIRSELDRHKVKDGDRVSFRVDGRNILQDEGVKEWWAEFGKQFEKSRSTNQSVCLITGKAAAPMATTPPVKGLQAVGGFGNGDALISFDKTAFQSYGLKKAANAPVSEDAFAGVKLALDELLKEAPALAIRKAIRKENAAERSTYARTFSGMKFVHWFSREIPPEDDPIYQSEDFFGWGEDAENEEDAAEDVPSAAKERELRKKADAVPESVFSGHTPFLPEGVRYHILLLSGVNGRVMIRRYEEGAYEKLAENLDRWHQDLRLVNPGGRDMLRDRKLFARLVRLISYRPGDPRVRDRVRDELSGLTAAIIHAILNNTPLPDSVAARALAYLRSQMVTSVESDRQKARIPDAIACQWLKAWLIRHWGGYNQEVQLMEEYNMRSASVPYHCGGMMAVFAQAQEAALGEVNAGIVARYYASAMQSPALVLGQLSKLSNYHLDKLDGSQKGLAVIFRKNLEEIASAIPSDTLPTALKLEEQSAFALGYYQMQAKMNREWRERRASNQEAKRAGSSISDEVAVEADEEMQMTLDNYTFA